MKFSWLDCIRRLAVRCGRCRETLDLRQRRQPASKRLLCCQDVVTAEYLSKRTGQSTRAVLSYGLNRQAGTNAPAGESTSISQAGVPLMLPQDLRNMDNGFSVLFSHRTKGTVRSYFPYPTELPHLRDICKLDPAR